MPAFIRTCGGIGDRLDLIIETVAAAIDTLDSLSLGDIDFASVEAHVDDKMFLEANMNSVELLQTATVEEVNAHATD